MSVLAQSAAPMCPTQPLLNLDMLNSKALVHVNLTLSSCQVRGIGKHGTVVVQQYGTKKEAEEGGAAAPETVQAHTPSC